MLSADKLTPRTSNFHPETMSLATYLVLVLQSQSIWPGPQGALRLPDPVCHSTKPHPSRDCMLASSLATQGPKGPQVERWSGGTWWALTSQGVPAYVRTSNSPAVTHSISRDTATRLETGKPKWQGGLGAMLATATPPRPQVLPSPAPVLGGV